MAISDQNGRRRVGLRSSGRAQLFYSRPRHPLESIAANNPQDRQFPSGRKLRHVDPPKISRYVKKAARFWLNNGYPMVNPDGSREQLEGWWAAQGRRLPTDAGRCKACSQAWEYRCNNPDPVIEARCYET
jgi:hypothetical protein